MHELCTLVTCLMNGVIECCALAVLPCRQFRQCCEALAFVKGRGGGAWWTLALCRSSRSQTPLDRDSEMQVLLSAQELNKALQRECLGTGIMGVPGVLERCS